MIQTENIMIDNIEENIENIEFGKLSKFKTLKIINLKKISDNLSCEQINPQYMKI